MASLYQSLYLMRRAVCTLCHAEEALPPVLLAGLSPGATLSGLPEGWTSVVQHPDRVTLLCPAHTVVVRTPGHPEDERQQRDAALDEQYRALQDAPQCAGCRHSRLVHAFDPYGKPYCNLPDCACECDADIRTREEVLPPEASSSRVSMAEQAAASALTPWPATPKPVSCVRKEEPAS